MPRFLFDASSCDIFGRHFWWPQAGCRCEGSRGHHQEGSLDFFGSNINGLKFFHKKLTPLTPLVWRKVLEAQPRGHGSDWRTLCQQPGCFRNKRKDNLKLGGFIEANMTPLAINQMTRWVNTKENFRMNIIIEGVIRQILQSYLL